MRIAVLKRTATLYAVVLAGVEAVVLLLYHDYDWGRIVFELAVSALIVTAVGLPVMIYVSVQHNRLKLLTERLAHLSAVDQMSGLLNRQTFLDRLDLQLHEARRSGSVGVFGYVDGDNFKSINDRFGHAVGDKVIQLIAEHIRRNIRQEDLSCRLGGEEFGIFFQGVDLEKAGRAADRIRSEIEVSGLMLGIPGFGLSVSIGLAAHRSGQGALDLMREADQSLYAAKHEGRNAVVVELKRYAAA